ncbi:MAG TPA: hypothetical protein GX736_03255 [Mogibacterium sp.]|nr:hypothetical protein [Mogibacterium sp.]
MRQRFKRITAIGAFFLLIVAGILYIQSSRDTFQPSDIFNKGKDTDAFLEAIPEYSGRPVHVINNNRPEFMNEEYKRAEKVFIDLSELDYMGRCGVCMASFGPDTLANEMREDMSHIYPTGWDQKFYEDIDNGGALYNRSHLLMYAMSGLGAEPRNLITGTRYMNSKGMLPYETATINWIKRYEERILYRATPVFKDRELVARGVRIEAADVRTKGDMFHIDVYCYNVQPGVKINYKTGHSE